MSEDLMFHMADVACIRAWEDEMWGPVHKKLLLMCVKTESNGWKRKTGMTQVQQIVNHMRKNGSITQREAYIDYGVQSFHRTLTRVKEAGYRLAKVGKIHPTTGQNYTRYYLQGSM